MKVKDCMTRDTEFVEPATTLKEAAKKMKELDCGFLAIGARDDGKLSGVVTDRDIAIRGVAEGRDPNTTTVDEIQTPKVLYCFEDDDIEETADNMGENQIYRLIVLNNPQEKSLCGVITLGDVVRHNETKAAGRAAESIMAGRQHDNAA